MVRSKFYTGHGCQEKSKDQIKFVNLSKPNS